MKYRKVELPNLSTEPAPYVSPDARIVGLENGCAKVGSQLEVLVDYPPYKWDASKDERSKWGRPVPTRFSIVLETPSYVNAVRRVISVVYDPLIKSARAVFPIVPLEPGNYQISLKFFDEENWRGDRELNLKVV